MKASGEIRSGVLYVVATPIGNLEDITLRALRVLKEADLIACEDTRHTRKLLDHYGIAAQTVSYHEHNEAARAEELMQKLEQGARIALVSDAGMPGISDPGYRVVALAVARGIPVVPVPGAAAAVAALAVSGLPTDSFRFGGFLPARKGARREAVERLRDSRSTEIFYEAPHHLKDALEDVVEVLGAARPVVIAREITKLHEEFLRGRAGEVLQQLQDRTIRGEVTLLIGKSDAARAEDAAAPADLAARLRDVMRQRQLDQKAALKIVAKELGISRSEAYRRLQRGKR
ncbi:MAG: 16S rRNA (cytidine(1402)-2'-O)-methyltransferase [Terriglobales bacterium]